MFSFPPINGDSIKSGDSDYRVIPHCEKTHLIDEYQAAEIERACAAKGISLVYNVASGFALPNYLSFKQTKEQGEQANIIAGEVIGDNYIDVTENPADKIPFHIANCKLYSPPH